MCNGSGGGKQMRADREGPPLPSPLLHPPSRGSFGAAGRRGGRGTPMGFFHSFSLEAGIRSGGVRPSPGTATAGWFEAFDFIRAFSTSNIAAPGDGRTPPQFRLPFPTHHVYVDSGA